jgi:hypothetical protein
MVEAADALHTRGRVEARDILLAVSVRVGRRLYDELKDAPPADAARLLRGYADRSTGAVRAMFLMLAEWQGLVPLKQLVELPDFPAHATGGCDAQVGLCGAPPCANNEMPVYVNGVYQRCDDCAITG